MKKIDKTIVCLIDDICYTIRYTEDSINVIHKCKAFTGSNFSKSYLRLMKKHGLENDFLQTSDSILDAVVNDRVKYLISEAMEEGKYDELLKDMSNKNKKL